MTHPRSTRLRSGFTLVELLVVIAIIGILVALLLPAVQSAREAARRIQCQSQIRNIALACANYESALREYPQGAAYNWDAGDDANGMSWHVFILPYMEDGVVSDELQELYSTAQASNGDINVYDEELEIFNQTRMPVYVCPSDGEAFDKWRKDYWGSSYSGVMGSAASRGVARYTVTGSGGSMSIDGMLFPLSEVTPRSITDGLSKTALVGERWYQLRVWTAGVYFLGGGWTVTQPTEPAENSMVSACKNVDLRYPLNLDLDDIGYYRSHDNRYDRPKMPAGAQRTIDFNNLPFGSLHPGGANFANVDCSVRFVSDDVDIEILVAAASRNGGEVNRELD